MASTNDVIIRLATKEDIVDVFKMIKELAKFEKMEDHVLINESVLIKDGFESACPAYFCYVAEDNQNKIIGYAIYYICYSTWLGKSIFLEDLYVQPAYQKQDIGKRLFLKVAKLAHDTSHRLDFHVLSWNPAIEFYKKFNAIDLTQTEKWHLFRLNKDCLNELFK